MRKLSCFHPRNTKDGYLIESGFITDKNIDIPNSSTICMVVSGNNKLTSQSLLNYLGLINRELFLKKEIALDDKFLFSVNQRVINSTDKVYDFYSYGQIIRNKIPDISNFYILHEGLLATLMIN